MADPSQSIPLRVFAPHRGAFVKSPVGLPFFNHPNRFAWGSFAILVMTPPSPPNVTDNRLPTLVNGNVFDTHRLLAPPSVFVQGLQLGNLRTEKLYSLIPVTGSKLKRLFVDVSSPKTLHSLIMNRYHLCH
jgi:hypothetical protein